MLLPESATKRFLPVKSKARPAGALRTDWVAAQPSPNVSVWAEQVVEAVAPPARVATQPRLLMVRTRLLPVSAT